MNLRMIPQGHPLVSRPEWNYGKESKMPSVVKITLAFITLCQIAGVRPVFSPEENN
jgi:hypothetical protein